MPQPEADASILADLAAAARAVDCADAVVRSGVAEVAKTGIDGNQVVAYDVAHAAAAVATALLDYSLQQSPRAGDYRVSPD